MTPTPTSRKAPAVEDKIRYFRAVPVLSLCAGISDQAGNAKVISSTKIKKLKRSPVRIRPLVAAS
jgi:hypothetical protein